MLGIVAGKYVMEAEWIIISLCLLITLILLYIKNKKINYTVWLFLAIIFATIGYMSCVKASLPYEFDGVVDDGDDVILDGIVFRQEQKNGKTILYLKDSVISFDSQNIESGVTILSLNEISYFYEGSNQGIKSIKNTLEKLNRINLEEDKNIKSVDITKNENLYNIKLYFSEKLIVKRRA